MPPRAAVRREITPHVWTQAALALLCVLAVAMAGWQALADAPSTDPTHREMRDQASVRAKSDHVDAVDLDPLDLSLELQHHAIITAPLADISEVRPAHHLVCGRQVLEYDVAPALRRVHDGTFEHCVGMQQVPHRSIVVRLHYVVAPEVEGYHPHVSGVCSTAWGDGLDWFISGFPAFCMSGLAKPRSFRSVGKSAPGMLVFTDKHPVHRPSERRLCRTEKYPGRCQSPAKVPFHTDRAKSATARPISSGLSSWMK